MRRGYANTSAPEKHRFHYDRQPGLDSLRILRYTCEDQSSEKKELKEIAMKSSTINLVILIVGIVLLGLGFNEYGTFGSRAGRMLGVGVSNKVLFLFIAGAVCTAFGLITMMKRK
jgi:hypothetical protein